VTDNELKTEIILAAKELGFDLVRTSQLDIPAHHNETFQRWVAEGQHAEMDYLKRRAENDPQPQDLLPGANSILSLASNYFRPFDRPQDDNRGRISCYSITRDYHKIIWGRLKKLDRLIQELGGKSRYYVDTGPVFERAFAESAGIGYIGKNSCVITQDFGSWVFIAEMLTTLDLPPDSNTLKLSCGRCRRCIDDCPTGAINEDYTVDSRKCISYLTIENRGGIPEELREGVGEWLFGCDICQEVCPHNHRAQISTSDGFCEVRIADQALPLADVLRLTDETFLARFAGSPIMRAKRRGLVRNACVVAGNIGDTSLLEPLREVAEDDDEMLREHASWAIARIEKAG
jgi:epoxyqueuosine reductase